MGRGGPQKSKQTKSAPVKSAAAPKRGGSKKVGAPAQKKISKAPRATRTILETVSDAKVTLPGAGKTRLPRVNRKKALAKKAGAKATAAGKGKGKGKGRK